MTATRVLVATPIEADLVERIAAAVPHVLYRPALLAPPRYAGDHDGDEAFVRSPAAQAEWAGLVAQADVVLGIGGRGPHALRQVAAGPGVKWIQGTTAGFGELVAALADRRGIRFTTASGLHGPQLAEWTMMVLLAYTKDLRRLRADQAARRWTEYPVRTLAGQTMVVVGLGHIGTTIARYAAALGMRTVGVRRSGGEPPDGVDELYAPDALPKLAGRADALVLALPHTPETIGIVDRTLIAALPPEAVVVNVGRGSAIDQDALVDALRNNRILGAGLDVFAEEPLPSDNPMWTLDNVIVSPHTASLAADENARLVDLFLANLDRYLAGRPLRNEVPPP